MRTITLALPVFVLFGCAAIPPASTVHRVNGVPVYQNNAEAKSGKQFIYTESPATPLHVLYTAEQAKAILDEFKVTYAKLGAPKIDVRVNLPKGAVQVPQVPIVSGGVAPAIDPATGLPMPAGAAAASGGPAAGGCFGGFPPRRCPAAVSARPTASTGPACLPVCPVSSPFRLSRPAIRAGGGKCEETGV